MFYRVVIIRLEFDFIESVILVVFYQKVFCWIEVQYQI